MKADLILRNATIVNRGQFIEADVFVHDGRIVKIGNDDTYFANEERDLNGGYLIPGVIDDQVHFREPGLTHKANIYTESRAAVAGGITSFMEMPNTKPPALTQELLQNIWNRIASDWKVEQLEQLTNEITLEQLDSNIELILQGKQKGRVLVKLI